MSMPVKYSISHSSLIHEGFCHLERETKIQLTLKFNKFRVDRWQFRGWFEPCAEAFPSYLYTPYKVRLDELTEWSHPHHLLLSQKDWTLL